MAEQLGFYLNLQGCTGCKACQIACKDKNGLEVSLLWRRVVEINGGEWLKLGDAWLDNTFTYNLSTACMHCEQPICMEVCPTRAISKRDNDGIVLIDAGRCMGCRYCEWACPYGAPQFNPATGTMTKCNLCYDYLNAGKPPACVSACQMRVLEFGELDELRAKYGPLNDVYPLPDPALTAPAVAYTPHRNVIHAETGPARIPTTRKSGMHSKEWPLIIFTLAAQLAAGMFVLLWGLSPALGPDADQFAGLLLIADVVLLGLGAVAATLHLGNPLNAWRALYNWRSSWLSREMLLGGIFGGLAMLFTALYWLGITTGPLRLLLGGLTALAGLALVFGIGKLYMLRTVPAWNSPATPVTFFATTFLLGSLTLGAALAVMFPVAQVVGLQQFLALLALLAMVVQVSIFALHTARLGGQGGAAALSARRLGVEFGRIALWRLVLVGVGVALFVAFAFQVMPLPGLAVVAFALVLLSEVMGRFLFYESYARVGL